MNSMEPKIDYKGDPQPEEMLINGDLSRDLLLGATIQWYNWDGWDWRVLVRMPKNAEWIFQTYDTLNWNIRKGVFSVMTCHKNTKKECVKAINARHFEAMFHRQAITKRNLKKNKSNYDYV